MEYREFNMYSHDSIKVSIVPGIILFLSVVHLLNSSCLSDSLQEFQSQNTERVVFYPTITTAVKSGFYTVSVNGAPAFTEQYKDIHYAYFAFADLADITVTADSDIKSYTISPKSYNIQSRAEGRKLSFTINKPQKLVVRINNSDRLFIFADPI